MASYRKLNFITDLKRMKRGQKTKADPRDIADWALQWVKVVVAQTDIEQLERLYRLKDPRE